MNKNLFEDISVPVEKLVAREKEAMMQAKRKRHVKKTTMRSLMVACGVCLSLLGSGFVSTGMAEALSSIPLLSPIYKDFRDIASDKIEQDHLATPIDKQDSHNGLTMTVKEAAYDGNRLIVTVVYTGAKGMTLKEENVGRQEITINGQPIKPAIGSTGQDDIKPNTIIEHHQYTLSNVDEYGDEIDIDVQGDNLFGYEGQWNVEFPLEKIKRDVPAFSPDATAKTDNGMYAITANNVTFSPLSTRIDLSVDYPAELDENDRWPWFEYTVVDDQGRVYDGMKLQTGMAEGTKGHHMVLTLPPMDEVPRSLTLKPSEQNQDVYGKELDELELLIPLKNLKPQN
ncbi:DUF4179 domain-containing protein [Rossellomorea marisflavi]|uniref:DUF4179 domain-containing protein n=1 Tax=Rossellomorea marisflavi TaxID=189381 RepID=UPI00064E619C|nr:DUF4179 domain-containing protein [Rossellomorea marisflavi]KMK95116.1 hypothetical protein VL03_10135 [Rossellomorea marisflavi]KML03207.1 hypothetical protein VL06_16385 [Rossellomorea marisflavi]